MPTEYVEVSGNETHYFYTGATMLPNAVPDFSFGRKIIFVHGGGSNAESFRHQIDGLGDKYIPISLDLPGHGGSTGAEGSPQWASMSISSLPSWTR